MKTVSNIILVLALVCYTFLPFYDVAIKGAITGFDFSAGLISAVEGWRGVTLALVPYLAGFLAIAFNSLHSRRWPLAAIGCILVALVFYYQTSHFTEIALMHQPEVAPANDLGEGFQVLGLKMGYWSSLALFGAALVSCIISLKTAKPQKPAHDAEV